MTDCTGARQFCGHDIALRAGRTPQRVIGDEIGKDKGARNFQPCQRITIGRMERHYQIGGMIGALFYNLSAGIVGGVRIETM